jgi:hypothetical protein
MYRRVKTAIFLPFVFVVAYSCKKSEPMGKNNSSVNINVDPRTFIVGAWMGTLHVTAYQAYPGTSEINQVITDTETIIANNLDGTISVNGKMFGSVCELDTITRWNYYTTSNCGYAGNGNCFFDTAYSKVIMIWAMNSGLNFEKDTFWGTK